MKVKITMKGVFGVDGKEVPVGTVIDVKGDAMPASLVNKAEIVGGSKPTGKTAVTNPAKGVKQEPKTEGEGK